jgi:lipoate-protein ligase B
MALEVIYTELSPELKLQFLGRLEYTEAVSYMQSLQQKRRVGNCPDTFLYLEHEPVITLGRGADKSDAYRQEHSIPVVEIARGGKATYHGPGQLIGYGIVNLKNRRPPENPDIGCYIRALEEGIISFLEAEFDIAAKQRDGFTGVWCTENGLRKIASIGVSGRGWVTSHGFALNLSTDLDQFSNLVPCGMPDVEMTSVQNELRRNGRSDTLQPMIDIAGSAHNHLTHSLARRGFLWQK